MSESQFGVKFQEPVAEIRAEIARLERRIDTLFMLIVRSDQHYVLVEDVKKLQDRVGTLERDVEVLKQKLSA